MLQKCQKADASKRITNELNNFHKKMKKIVTFVNFMDN